MFDIMPGYGISPLFFYVCILIVEVYAFYIVGQAMIRYSHALSKPAQTPLMERIDEVDSYEYYSESAEDKASDKHDDEEHTVVGVKAE